MTQDAGALLKRLRHASVGGEAVAWRKLGLRILSYFDLNARPENDLAQGYRAELAALLFDTALSPPVKTGGGERSAVQSAGLLDTIDAIISGNVYVDNDGIAGISSAAEAILEHLSCGAESNRHSGAVGTDKRAEHRNPGGGHVTEPQLSGPYEQKPSGTTPRPDGVAQAQTGCGDPSCKDPNCDYGTDAEAAAAQEPDGGLRVVLANQLAIMCALHQIMRGFLAPDPLAQKRLSDCILATRVFGVSLDDSPSVPSASRGTEAK